MAAQKITLLDGAMGTMLQHAGLQLGDRPETLSITAPDVVEHIQRQYVQAGTRMFDRMEAGDDEEQCRALKSYTKKMVATIRNYFPEYEVCGEVYVRARSNLEPSADDEIEDVTAVHGGWEFNARVFGFEATDLKGFCTMR